MGRLGTIVGLTVGVMLVLPAGAGASHTPTGEPFGEDFVTGTFSTGVANLTIDAHSGPSGENPTGQAEAEDRLGSDTGRVTCLLVAGNRATVGLDFTSAGGGWFFLEDGGTGGPDLFAGVANPTGEAPSACPADSPRPLTIAGGDVIVHDARAVPSSKDQCRNGGWRRFPQFHNQLQCNLFIDRTCGQRGRFEPKPKHCPATLPNR